MEERQTDIEKVICDHWPRDPNGCAALCMDRLGSIPKTGCAHRRNVHGKMADAIRSAIAEALK